MVRLLPRRLAPDEQATLVEHLTELRQRLILSMIVLAPLFGIAYAFHKHLIDWLIRLLPADKQGNLVTLGVTEPFTISLKVSFYAALALALPFLVWQAWGFFAPALDHAMQRSLSIFLVFATALFAGGVSFSYFVILPKALKFLTNYDDELFADQIRANYYLSFVTLSLFATGIAFLMPIFILALVRIRVLTAERLRRNRRIGMVAMLSFAILLPTVDPVSLALEVAPLLILFEMSIWLSAFMEKRWERQSSGNWAWSE